MRQFIVKERNGYLTERGKIMQKDIKQEQEFQNLVRLIKAISKDRLEILKKLIMEKIRGKHD